MTHPDNFSAAAFRRAHGDDAYDDAAKDAETLAFFDVRRAAKLKAAIDAMALELEMYDFHTIFPAAGYEMEDLLGMMRDIRDKIDLDAYAKKAREIALDKELSR